MSKTIPFSVAILLLVAASCYGQSVPIPYSGSAPYSGSVPVTVNVPAGCTTSAVGTTITVTCGTPPPPSTITSVSASCVPSSVATGGSSTCAANVQGTGSFNPAVTWSASAGTITNSGVLTAPGSAQTVTVTATSVQDPTKSGPASVTVTASSVCSQSVSPTGGTDNSNILAKVSAANGGCVEVKAGTVNYNITATLNLPSGANLECDTGATFNATGSYPPFNGGMFSTGAKATINNCGFQMPSVYATNAPNQGNNQYNPCIYVANATNVTLTGNNFTKCGGDGITLVNGSGITITGNKFNGTQIRQQVAIVGGVTANISTNIFTGETPFGADLDVEPDSDVSITLTLNQNQFGTGSVSYGIYALTSCNSTVNITGTGNTYTNSDGYGVFFTNGCAKGSIVTTNDVLTNSGYNALYGRWSNSGPLIAFVNPIITNPNRAGNDPHYGQNNWAGIGLTNGQTLPCGGLSISNATVNGGNGPFNATAWDGSTCVNTTVSGTWNGNKISFP